MDPADIPTAARLDACEIEVLLYELKADLNAYLATRGTAAAASTLKDLIAFNERERAREMPYFGQELFVRAESQGAADVRPSIAPPRRCAGAWRATKASTRS